MSLKLMDDQKSEKESQPNRLQRQVNQKAQIIIEKRNIIKTHSNMTIQSPL